MNKATLAFFTLLTVGIAVLVINLTVLLLNSIIPAKTSLTIKETQEEQVREWEYEQEVTIKNTELKGKIISRECNEGPCKLVVLLDDGNHIIISATGLEKE